MIKLALFQGGTLMVQHKQVFSCGAGELSYWSRALAALPVDLGLIPKTHMVNHSDM